MYDRPIWRGDQAEFVLSLGVGGRFPINRLLPALSEQHELAGKIELSYRFPFARISRVWKTCVSPVGDASLLIDGDASKTFKIARRSRRKETERGTLGEDDSTPRSHVARSLRRLHIWERSLRQKERVSLSSASSHTSRQGHHEAAEGFLIFGEVVGPETAPRFHRMADGQQPGEPRYPRTLAIRFIDLFACPNAPGNPPQGIPRTYHRSGRFLFWVTALRAEQTLREIQTHRTIYYFQFLSYMSMSSKRLLRIYTLFWKLTFIILDLFNKSPALYIKDK